MCDHLHGDSEHPGRSLRSEDAHRPAGRGAAVLAATLAATAAMVGCGATAGSSDAQQVESTDVFSSVLTEAREQGAGPDQIADLEVAQRDRSISTEVTRQAAQRAVQCMTDLGVDATYVNRENFAGLNIAGYQVGVAASDDGAWHIVEQCDVQEFYWVSQAYQLQPSAWEAKEAYANSHAQELRRCLEGTGASTDPDASGVDLVHEALQLLDTNPSADCLAAAGITSW